MDATHPAGYLRLLVSIAALGLLAGLLLLPAPVRAQARETIAPTLLGARVSGTSLVLVYNEALDSNSIPAASAYSVVFGTGTSPTLTGVGISGARVTLTLSTASTASTTVTVTYTVPSTGNKLQDATQNAVAALPNYSVANNNATTNAQPVFSSATTTRSVAENTASGMNVGAVVPVTDADTLTYALVGPDASSFTIETTSGQIKTNAALDFETTPTSYSVVVSVRDNMTAADGMDTVVDDAIVVTINVTNVNEPPMITSGANIVTKPENTATSEILASYTATDPDVPTTFTWTLTGTDAGDFVITKNSTTMDGELKFRNEPNFESPTDQDNNNDYDVTVNVSDGTLSATQDVTINVTNVNEPPVITTVGSTYVAFSVAENTATSVVLKTYMADDPESDTLTWSLSGHNADTSDFTITTTGQLKFSNVPNYESPTDNLMDNVYNVTVNVRDTIGGSIDASIAVTVTVTNVDEAGTASFTGTLSGGSTLTASVTDPDGSIGSKSYRWQRGETSGGGFSNITTNATGMTYVPVAADVTRYLRVKVNYTDGQGSGKSATSDSRGPIGASNSEPTFINGTMATRTLPENSGPLVNVVGGTVTATDSDSGDTLTYGIKSGNDSGRFTIVPTSGQIQAKSGETYNYEDSKNSYTVIVTVHDGKDAAGGNSTTVDDEITVTINLTNVNEAPVITTSATTASVAENSTAVFTLTATDVDASTTFEWSVESGDDGGKFSINQSTGALSFSNAPDFETPTDTGDTAGNNTYVVTVKVEDNGIPGNATAMSDTHTLRVTVTNINEAPTITSTGTTFSAPSFDENGTSVVATYTATDVDANSDLTWSVENNDFGDFTIMENGDGHGELKFKLPPDYEDPIDADTNNTYSLTVKVRDNHTGQLSDTLNVVVTVNDVNEAPEISGGATPSFAEIEYSVAHPTNRDVDTYSATDDDSDSVSWAVSGTDAAHFSINTNGVLSFDINPDFENPVDMVDTNMMGASNNLYVVVVEATDDNTSVLPYNQTGTLTVTVRVTNIDERPEITDGSATPRFAEIEYDAATADLMVDTYTARDEEDEDITWSVTGDDAGDFTITKDANGMGVLTFNARANYEMPADDNTDNNYDIEVRATDGNVSPNISRHTTVYAVTVTVTDVNERPDISENFDGLQEYMEIEYDFMGTGPDVHTFMAEDYDAGDTFTWTVTGTDAAYLDIGASDGVLTFTQDSGFNHGPLPNFEHPRDEGSNNTYTITVVATDNHAKAEEYAVIVTVTDVNEAPEFTGTPNLAITYNENAITDVSSYAARDEEGGVTWSLTGADSGKFSIDSGGTVTFNATPDWETPVDSGGNNVYEFSVVATDVLSGSPRRDVSVDVTVTVADVEEPGAISVKVNNIANTNNPAVGDTVTFELTDPDGGILIEGSQNGFNWNIQTRTSETAPWQQIALTNNVSTSFSVTVTEDHTGKELRTVVDPYTDRRGTGGKAESMATAAVTADPIPNAPPRFTGGGPSQIAEGGDPRDVGEPMRATDRDLADTLTFGIQTSQYSDHFEINASTGQIRLTQVLDLETGFLLLTVTLHDGMDADDNVEAVPIVDVTTILAITIRDVEEEGVVTLSSTEPAVGTQLRAMLADGDGDVTGSTWQWSRSENGRSPWTTISGARSSNYTPGDADGDFFLRARVTYTDRRGSGKSAEAITTERVFGENQRPTFPSTESGARTVAENTGAGESVGDAVAAVDTDNDLLTYSLSGTDAAAFSIVTTTGQLRTLEPLDFETKPSYSVTVEVHDGLDALGNTSTTVDDMQAVTITIENVEEQGTVTLSSDTGTIRARVPVMATLADDDIPSSVTWQWSRSPTKNNWVNILGATSSTFTPTDDDEGNFIRATAMYTDGEGSNKSAEEVSARVGDAPPVNLAPAFPTTETGQREVAENAGSGSTFGDPVVATDFNSDILYYSLSGTDAASFEIGQNTGQLSLASSVTLDFEGKRTYRVTVEVSDRADPLDDADMAIDDRQSVTVTVTNVNEAPVVTGAATASIEENSSSTLGSYSATDPERDTLTWSVSGNDFWISDQGQLYFRSPPSFEQSTSYTVTVMAEDDGMLSGSLSVTVTVTDVEEDGVITLSPLRGWDGTSFVAVLDDDDGVRGSVDWQWQRSSNRSGWNDITGGTSMFYTATTDDVGQYLRATVLYEDGRGMDKDADAGLTVRIADSGDRPSMNNAPTFADTSTERSVGQGTSAGRPIGAPVRATDEDPDDILTYTLFGNDASDFDIDRATGQLRTKAVLDYDSDPPGQNDYTIVVEVRDGFDSTYNPATGVDDTITVTITVTQVAQRVITGGGGGGGGFGPALTAPKFVDGFRTTRPLPVNALAGDAVGDPVAATHPNDDDVTYSLSGANAALFTVDEETGQIRLGQAVTLALGQSYTVNLTATDSTGTGSIIIVVIEVVEAALHLYDLNRDGIIEKDEVLAAASDYFAELIDKPLVLEVIALYFAD